jgi:hypothetical protein
MSLFDVIRYGDIDLNSRDEIANLPPDIFAAYQRASYAYFHTGDMLLDIIENHSLESQASYLAVKWMEDNHLKYPIFKKVLLDYEPI